MATRQPSSRTCFVCGRDNPIGLKVRWDSHPDAREIRAAVKIPGDFNGYPGVAHGGVLAALLDETAGRTVLMDGDFDDLMVTARLEVGYRFPTPTDTPLVLVGRLLRRGENRAEAEAEVQLADGTVTAYGRVVLARPPDAIYEAWEPERAFFKVDPD